MSKTPFEIRLDLLGMAQSIVNENLYSERARLEQDWHAAKEMATIVAQKGGIVPGLTPFPTLPTINEDEIVRLAKKLNDFVSNNNTD